MTEPTDLAAHSYIVGRVSWAARALHRFSVWGATAGLIAGTITLLALLPLLPRIGDRWPVGALVLTLALVAAPLRVMWHGHKIRATYGDPADLMAVIEWPSWPPRPGPTTSWRSRQGSRLRGWPDPAGPAVPAAAQRRGTGTSRRW